jgi:hypothetical protein
MKYEADSLYKKFGRIMMSYTVYTLNPVIFMFLEPLGEYAASGKLKIPMLIDFPFDTENSIIAYFVAFSMIVYGYGLYWIANVTTDRILYGTVTVLALEFKILRSKFLELRFMHESDVKMELKQLIVRHSELVSNTAEVQDIFAVSLFINFILTSILICSDAFMFTTSKDIGGAVLCVSFSFYSAIFIFLQCYFGQMLREASDGVISGIFECEWEKIVDVKLKRDLILVLRQAQKPAQLSIFKVSPVNIEQFGSVSSIFNHFRARVMIFSCRSLVQATPTTRSVEEST